MGNKVPGDVGFLRFALPLRKMASRAVVALMDKRVPARLKWMALAAIIFVISPLNLLGDIPLLGVLDDGALLGLVLVWFARVSMPYMRTYDVRPIIKR